MDAPPLKDTDIEGDLQAMKQTIAALIRTMEPGHATRLILMLEQIVTNAQRLEGQDARLDAVMSRMNETLHIFGHQATLAVRDGEATPPTASH